MKTGACGGEDGEADSLFDDGRGDGEEGAVLFGLGGGSGGFAVGVDRGGFDGLGGLGVCVDAVLCGDCECV